MRTTFTAALTAVLMGTATMLTAATPTPAPAPAPSGTAGGAAAEASGQPYTMYSAIPRVAGIKTLIDFNDYETIISNAMGYVNVRYLNREADGEHSGYSAGLPNTFAEAGDMASQTGNETGMPVMGFVLDPPHQGQDMADGDPDRHFMRQLTDIGNLFTPNDPSRQADAYAAVINRSDSPPSYEDLPKDRFGGIVYTLSNEDMALDSWLVELNSSANTIPNRRNTFAKRVTNFANTRSFLGIRIRFPDHGYNAHARVAPMYAFPVFDARGYPINYGFFDPNAPTNPFTGSGAGNPPTHVAVRDARIALEDLAGNPSVSSQVSYNGVIHNVGDVKEVVCRVAGRNYRNGVAIRVRNHNDEVSEYFLGYTDFVGWRTLRWQNPSYIPADEMEPFRLPLYPTEIPYLAMDSLVVYRDGNDLGGDFVTYVDYIKMDYDLAVPAAQLDIDMDGFIDIDDDAWWYILRDRNQARAVEMMRRFSHDIDLRRQQLGRTTRHTEGAAPVENADYETLNDNNARRNG